MVYSCAWVGRQAAVAALVLCGCPALAERASPAQIAQVTPAVLAEPRVIDPPALYLGARAGQPFLEERAHLMDAVIAAEDRQPDLARAMTDLAEFFFAHAMAPEGLSVLSAGMTSADELRAIADVVDKFNIPQPSADRRAVR